MRNDEIGLPANAKPGADDAAGTAERLLIRQRLRGVEGRLRPYRDVRSGFEPWRRIALRVWAAREEGSSVH